MNDLSIVYAEQGRHQESNQLLREVIRIREERFGADHLTVAEAKHNLSNNLFEQKENYQEAERLGSEALATRKRALGDENEKVAKSLLNLAHIYNETGRYGEAFKLGEEASEIGRKLFDNQHPLVTLSHGLLISCGFPLGSALIDQKKYQEAEKILRETIERLKKIDEDNRFMVATTLRLLGRACNRQGKHKEAENICKQALEMLQTINTNDPEFFNVYDRKNFYGVLYLCRVELSEALNRQSKLDEAHKVLREALEDTHDNAHYAYHCRECIGLLYYNQSKYEEAKKYYEEALAIGRKLYGEQDPATIDLIGKIADIYEMQGLTDKAKALREIVVALSGQKN